MRHGFPFSTKLKIKFPCCHGFYRCSSSRIAFEGNIRCCILPRASPSIEQAHTVSDKPMTMCHPTSLHGFQIRIFHIGNHAIIIYFYTNSLGNYIFIDSVQIIYPFTELFALLLVEYLENVVIGKFCPDTDICSFQFIRELLTQILPKHTVMTSKSIHCFVRRGKFRINSIFVNVPIILQTSVITYTKDSIIIVEYHVSKHSIHVR